MKDSCKITVGRKRMGLKVFLSILTKPFGDALQGYPFWYRLTATTCSHGWYVAVYMSCTGATSEP